MTGKLFKIFTIYRQILFDERNWFKKPNKICYLSSDNNTSTQKTAELRGAQKLDTERTASSNTYHSLLEWHDGKAHWSLWSLHSSFWQLKKKQPIFCDACSINFRANKMSKMSKSVVKKEEPSKKYDYLIYDYACQMTIDNKKGCNSSNTDSFISNLFWAFSLFTFYYCD